MVDMLILYGRVIRVRNRFAVMVNNFNARDLASFHRKG